MALEPAEQGAAGVVTPAAPTRARADLHKQAFWLYGVIVGLAIKEAIVGVFGGADPQDDTLHILRLAAFLLLIGRFYLGSSLYFDELRPNAYLVGSLGERGVHYGLDIALGFVHFLIFSIWSLTVERPAESDGFIFGLFLILTWDWLWFVLCFKSRTRDDILYWAVVNGITALLVLVLLLGLQRLEVTEAVAEQWALVPVIVISILELAEILSGLEIIRRPFRAIGARGRGATAPQG